MRKLYGVLLGLGAAGAIGVLGVYGASFGFFGGGPKVGVVEVSGPIQSSEKTVNWIERLASDGEVRAIVVRVNSPGGGVTASQEIYYALKRARDQGKPVVAYFSSVAASGGYYVGCAADKIVASPGSITGSIGVIIQIPVVESLMSKVGVSWDVYKSKEHKDYTSPFRTRTEFEAQLIEWLILDVYDQFVDVVTEARGLPRDSVLASADGRVFSGRQAKELGFVDETGTFQDAVDLAAELAGVERPKLKEKKKKTGLFYILFDDEEANLEGLTRLVADPFTPMVEYRWYGR